MANQVLTGVSTVLQCCVKRSVHQQVALFVVLYFLYIIQVTRLDDSMVLFLASLPEEEYKCVLEIFKIVRLKGRKYLRPKEGSLVELRLTAKALTSSH